MEHIFIGTKPITRVGNEMPRDLGDELEPSSSRVYAYQDHQYFLTLGNGPWGDLAWT